MNHLREFLASIDSLALAVEVLDTHAVWVVVATVGIALASEAIIGVGTTAGIGLTDVVFVGRARMGRESERVRIGFPNVNLSTAGSIGANASIGIVGGRLPALNIGLLNCTHQLLMPCRHF